MITSLRPAKTLRVLLVEDSLLNQKIMLGLLARQSCNVTLANNGQEALDQLHDAEFDVVLMDVQMPIMDGLTATRLIRKQEGTTAGHIPIIAVTAGMDRSSCLEAGMDAFLAKPVRSQALMDVLELVLHQSG